MPDRRTKRGPNPKDKVCFGPDAIPILRAAVADLSWLRSRGYSDRASLKLVGDRYCLRDRQRKALQRCAAASRQVRTRAKTRVGIEHLDKATVVIDGYNVILSLEAALCGGVLLLARDGVLRDLAAMSSHYRRVEATPKAIDLLGEFLDHHNCGGVRLLLDRPVSNSGRLKQLITDRVADRSATWEVELTDRTDQLLIESPSIVATADSAILDRCSRWFNLSRTLIEQRIPSAWIIDLSHRKSESTNQTL